LASILLLEHPLFEPQPVMIVPKKEESTMGFLGYMKDILTVASILSLIVVGLAIALKSGVVAVGPDRSRLVLGNLSQLVLTLAGCLLVLGMIQQMIGVRLGAIW
jgi:hypothetical protein